MKPILAIATGILVALLSAGCHSDIKPVWRGSSGRVPASWPTPAGFTVSPSHAQDIAELHYGKKKTIQHIYADSHYYYIVNGFAGSSPSSAFKTGVIIDGISGECSQTNLTKANAASGKDKQLEKK